MLAASGVRQKLKALSQNKKCEELKPWLQSIITNLYWAAISTPAGDGELIVAKVAFSGASHTEHP